MTDRAKAQAQLNDFDPAIRQRALETLAGALTPGDYPEFSPLHVNMHCHTFYSYNGYGASPSAIAWKGRTDGWHAAGICDFDVLDGLEEFIGACDRVGLRGTVNMETRVFFKEYSDAVINSPGEPGIYYFMGAGFVRLPAEGSAAGKQLKAMRDGAAARNRDVVERVNAYLGDLRLDYSQDVLPLTPAGNATERHICTAYYERSREHFAERADWVAFWSGKLGISAAEADALYDDAMAFNDTSRGKLMKAGGPGYVQPNAETFPALDDVIAMIRACDAIPMGTWLDGLNPGEADMQAQLELLMDKGVEAINIIPDRNWNLKAGKVRNQKVAKLFECVEVADRLHLPINIGTELNKFGQPWIDDFTSEPMRKVSDSFLRGARIMVGHTRLLRYAGVSYIGDKARGEFPDRQSRNDFFEAVGALGAPSQALHERLLEEEADTSFATLHNAATRGEWSSDTGE